MAGDPSLPRAEAKGNIKGDMFSCPDGLWVDGRGVLWIQCDMSTSAMGKGDLKNFGNNMMLAADVNTGEVRRFLVGPAGCEVTGVTTTPDGKTMFVNIQHPGEPANELTDPKNPVPCPTGPRRRPTAVLARLRWSSARQTAAWWVPDPHWALSKKRAAPCGTALFAIGRR